MPHNPSHFYLVELYNPKPTWQELTTQEREAFLMAIGKGMEELAATGIEVLALSKTQASIDNGAAYGFIGIWRFPDVQLRSTLLGAIAASGWYDYFDHINAASDGGDFSSHLKELLAS